MPTTTASPAASARIPASLRSPTSRSFGHFRSATTPVVAATASAIATAAATTTSGARPAGARAAAAPRRAATRPGGALQVRPSRPRPARWWSATTTRPSGAPDRAASSRYRFVESVSASQRTLAEARADWPRDRARPVGYGDPSPPAEVHVLQKILIANRGEIAVRVMRTCRELGIPTVAVYSELDRDALHVRYADEAYALGGQTAAESYLNTDAILGVIERSGADARAPRLRLLRRERRVRPGDRRPRRHLDRPAARGDRRHGRQDLRPARPRTAAASRASPAPSTRSRASTTSIAFGEKVGWPVAIKAAYGGGGEGMKVVRRTPSTRSRRSTPRSARRRRTSGGPRRTSRSTSPGRATSRCRSSPTPTATRCGSASATAPCSAATRS